MRLLHTKPNPAETHTRGASAVALLAVLVAALLLVYFIVRMLGLSNMRAPEGFEAIGEYAGENGWSVRVREPKSGTVFRLVPSGRFKMGSPPGEAGRDELETEHFVEITRPFYVAETETTQAQWQRVMKSAPSRFAGQRNPVERVSWNEAVAYCEKIGCRLPTEAEWEYACRAGTRTPYAFGKSLNEHQARFGGNAKAAGEKAKRKMSTLAVRSFTPNAFGLCDLHGNVYEWCADWFGEYPESSEADPLRDPEGPENGETRVVRGGSWGSEVESLRSAGRDDFGPKDRNAYIGFRAVKVPE